MRVVVAIIYDVLQRILITQRPLHVSQGGFWEFPGGKVEATETAEAAIIREIKEELGLVVLNPILLGKIQHQYPDMHLQLIIYKVRQFSGNPMCLAGQLAFKWMPFSELNPKDFPQANQAIFEMLYPNLSMV
ncbi:MAG: 8-oxo-dGTP diphosphatase MutT [Legionella sp.]|nr:8-oxo-dGTP diphosphatase MutT [Legionella sp.]